MAETTGSGSAASKARPGVSGARQWSGRCLSVSIKKERGERGSHSYGVVQHGGVVWCATELVRW